MILDILSALVPKNNTYTVGAKTNSSTKIPVDVELKIDTDFKRTIIVSALVFGVGVGVGVGAVNALTKK